MAVSGLLFFALSGRWEWNYLLYAALGFPVIIVGSYIASFAFNGMSWVAQKLSAIYLILFPGLKVLSREYQQEQRQLEGSEKRWMT